MQVKKNYKARLMPKKNMYIVKKKKHFLYKKQLQALEQEVPLELVRNT